MHSMHISSGLVAGVSVPGSSPAARTPHSRALCTVPAGRRWQHRQTGLSGRIHSTNAGTHQADLAQAEAAISVTTEDPEVLSQSAAQPRQAPDTTEQSEQQQQEQGSTRQHANADNAASTSGRTSSSARSIFQGSLPDRAKALAALWAEAGAEAQAVEPPAPPLKAQVDLLPEKNYGNLRGGQYPFAYDPVYGLPIVRDVASYGEVLRDIREDRVEQVLWFFDPGRSDPYFVDGRCLIRYKDGRVKQSVIPQDDYRVPYAMEAHGVRGAKLPLEPRHVVEYAAWDDSQLHPLQRWMKEHVHATESPDSASRRGPRIGPTIGETVAVGPQSERDQVVDAEVAAVRHVASSLQRLSPEEWAAYEGAGRSAQSAEERANWDREMERRANDDEKQSWSDRIVVSQDLQAAIYKYVPIIGPILGSAFVLGLYVTARLLKGDLTDRMKVMNVEDDKRKRTALREARIAFLEEEMPALVAGGADFETVKKKAATINAKLGEKFEISETELQGTFEACTQLLSAGDVDMTGDAGSTTAAERILAQEDAEESKAAAEGGEGGQKNEADALMEMGKLNTARIRKAVDPRILEVKKRVRQARRQLKRESKVQISDEIIFFDDVAGNEQAKIELMEVVDFFRKPEKFRASGARPPKGVLLVGPPGNGKTLMARAVAGESGVAFISSSASEFIEMYMGLGAARVRDLFNTTRKMAPCIIFIDELDAVGRARRSGGQGNDERDNTVNQLLTEMDGFEAGGAGIVVMAATNRKDVLDSALTRPGRFDRSIEVRRPDYQGRLEGIKVHLRDKPISHDINYEEAALLTGGMSGAQIAGVCNTACFLASREGRVDVSQEDLVKAIDQSKYGKSYEATRFMSPARRHRYAALEAGISLTATLLPAIEPIDFVTIVPSVKSPLGRTVLTPSIARHTTGVWTRTYLEQQLQMALAGRAAEEVLFGPEELSSLNQHRLMFARQIATKMLNSGFSAHPDFEHIRTLGHNYLDPSIEPGRWTLYTTTTDDNQSRSEWIDTDMELEALLNRSYAEAKARLVRNGAALDALVELLLERERVDGEEIRKLVEATAAAEDLAQRAKCAELAFM